MATETAARIVELGEAVDVAEATLGEAVVGIIGLLGSDHTAVKPLFPKDPATSKCPLVSDQVSKVPLDDGAALVDASVIGSAANRTEAAVALVELPFVAKYPGEQPPAKRLLAAAEEKRRLASDGFTRSAIYLEEASLALDSAICEVRGARDKARVEKEAAVLAAAGGDRSKAGVICASLSAALATYNISPQRYWKGALVGPDARRLALNNKASDGGGGCGGGGGGGGGCGGGGDCPWDEKEGSTQRRAGGGSW